MQILQKSYSMNIWKVIEENTGVVNHERMYNVWVSDE